jgi:hypothetical protein
MRPYLEKPFTKIGLMEWLKVKVLSSSPSTSKKKMSEGGREGKLKKKIVGRQYLTLYCKQLKESENHSERKQQYYFYF